MEQTKCKEVRVHRVGSITAGISLVAWGIMFILHEVNIISSYEIIVRLWPLILIGLGGEILWSTIKNKNVIYDKGAVFLMIIMAGFAMMMGVADACVKYGMFK